MAGEPKLDRPRRCRERVVDDALGSGRDDEVRHRAALDADEVVVMTDEVLVELVAGVIVAAGNSPNDAGGFEVGEIAIDRTLGELRAVLQQLGHRGRVSDVEQGIDQSTSTLGVHESTRAQATPDFGVNSFIAGRHCDERTCGGLAEYR